MKSPITLISGLSTLPPASRRRPIERYPLARAASPVAAATGVPLSPALARRRELEQAALQRQDPGLERMDAVFHGLHAIQQFGVVLRRKRGGKQHCRQGARARTPTRYSSKVLSLISHNEYNNANPVVKPDWPASQTGRERGGARDEPAVSSGSWGVSKLWDQGSHATATIGAKPAELTGCSNGKGPT